MRDVVLRVPGPRGARDGESVFGSSRDFGIWSGKGRSDLEKGEDHPIKKEEDERLGISSLNIQELAMTTSLMDLWRDIYRRLQGKDIWQVDGKLWSAYYRPCCNRLR